jgi:hypothetical protein
MKKAILIVLAIFVFAKADAQTDTLKTTTDSTVNAEVPKSRRDTRPWNERIAFGFGTGFWINVNTSYLELAPVVAYRFPKALIAGVGYRYIYRHQRIYGIDLNSWGPDFFTRLQLLKRVYLWTEYEILTSQYLAQAAGNDLAKEKDTFDSFFAGLGYIRSVGKKGRGGISIQVLYNFLYERDDFSPYYSPVTYRVGYYF